jgi:hypothetical protein
MKRTKKELEIEICQLYLSNMTNKEISEKFGLNRGVVQTILKRNNIVLRKQTETARKNTLNNFYDGIKNNNDAYLLGLIYSDGNLFKNNIEISLNEGDKQILVDISNYVYGYEKLSYRKGRKFIKDSKEYESRGQYRFLISSKNVKEKLIKIGLCEKKSLIIRYPIIDSKYYSHFIRGVFDGDGCIFISKKYKGTNRVSIVSNENFCIDLKKIIEEYLKINIKIYNKTANVKTLTISGNKQIKTFMEWIYTDAELKLDRKYIKFHNEYNQPPS